jgi:transcriptional regulator with XRE-family HTH domain
MVNVSSIGSYIREQREQAKISIRQLAQAAGVSNPYLSQVERGLRRPSADILQQIARGLRISAEALYVQAGILDDKRSESSVTEAIMADQEITERQKQMLIDIYESFRKEVRAGTEARAGAKAGAGREPASEAGDDPVVSPETDPVTQAFEESGHDPLASAVAAAEAEPWTDPPAAASG